MATKVPPNPDLDAMLADLASFGMRAAGIAMRLMEIEHAAAAVVAADLPKPGIQPQSLGEAEAAGRAVDAVNEIMAQTVPRVAILSRVLDRSTRSVRFAVALTRRIEAGWPRVASDSRQAMLRRQVARGVSDAIRRQSDAEPAERLFDDLARLLDDPAIDAEIGVLPEADIVRRICRALGLAIDTVLEIGGRPPPAGTARPADTS